MFYRIFTSAILLLQGIQCRNDSIAARAKTSSGLKPITLAIILPSSKPYIFRKQLVIPAIEYAVAFVEKELSSLGFRYEIEYRNSFCDYRQAESSAIELCYGLDKISGNHSNASNLGFKDGGSRRKRRQTFDPISPCVNFRNSGAVVASRTPMVFLGPACDAAADEVSMLAEWWNIPMITSGAPAWTGRPDKRTTLTRTGPTHYDLARFIFTIFRSLGHGQVYPIHLLYEPKWNSGNSENECHSVMQTVLLAFPVFDEAFHVYAPKIVDENVDLDKLVKNLMEPRVVLMCASSPKVRHIMISAYKSGNADPDTSQWYAIDLHNRTHYSQYAWRTGDDDDSIAKEAFKALMIITSHARKTPQFHHFRQAMLQRYRRDGIHEDVNEFVIGFHDAVILHKQALATCTAKGIDITDGSAVTTHMRKVLIQGIAGPVVIGEHGNKRGDYSVLAMKDYKAGTFSSVFDYQGAFEYRNGKLPMLNSTKIAHLRNITSCNRMEEYVKRTSKDKKELDDMIESTESQDLLFGVVGSIGGMTLCCLLVMVPVCRRKQRRPKPRTSENGTASSLYVTGNPEEVFLHRPLRQEASVATCMTTIDPEEDIPDTFQ